MREGPTYRQAERSSVNPNQTWPIYDCLDRLCSEIHKPDLNLWSLETWIPNRISSISKNCFSNLWRFNSRIPNRTSLPSNKSESPLSRVRISNLNRSQEFEFRIESRPRFDYQTIRTTLPTLHAGFHNSLVSLWFFLGSTDFVVKMSFNKQTLFTHIDLIVTSRPCMYR